MPSEIFYVEMTSLEIPGREDYREMCGKRHMSDTDKSTTAFWDEVIMDPNPLKKHPGLLLSPTLSFDQIALLSLVPRTLLLVSVSFPCSSETVSSVAPSRAFKHLTFFCSCFIKMSPVSLCNTLTTLKTCHKLCRFLHLLAQDSGRYCSFWGRRKVSVDIRWSHFNSLFSPPWPGEVFVGFVNSSPQS